MGRAGWRTGWQRGEPKGLQFTKIKYRCGWNIGLQRANIILTSTARIIPTQWHSADLVSAHLGKYSPAPSEEGQLAAQELTLEWFLPFLGSSARTGPKSWSILDSLYEYSLPPFQPYTTWPPSPTSETAVCTVLLIFFRLSTTPGFPSPSLEYVLSVHYVSTTASSSLDSFIPLLCH